MKQFQPCVTLYRPTLNSARKKFGITRLAVWFTILAYFQQTGVYRHTYTLMTVTQQIKTGYDVRPSDNVIWKNNQKPIAWLGLFFLHIPLRVFLSIQSRKASIIRSSLSLWKLY